MLQAALLCSLFPPQILRRPNLRDAVVYEVNIRAFSPEGSFKGVTDRLDQIQSVGTNVLWLMPIYPVGKLRSAGGLGSPYAVQNYDEVNPEFGTLKDFETLVKEAHKRKMQVVLDWVANHTSWDNPGLAHKDWYHLNDKGEIQIPAGTNWKDVAALNYDSKPMRTAMIRSMQVWLQKKNIDGFRCDYADGIPADFWKTAIDTLRSSTKKPLFMLAEGARPNHLESGFDLIYGWPAYGALKDIYNGKASAKTWTTKGLEDTKPSIRFISNHDFAAWDGSAVQQFGGQDASFGAFAVSALSRGVPMIYTGQEIGWEPRVPFFTKSPIDWSTGKTVLDKYQRLMNFRRNSLAPKSDTFVAFSNERVIGFVKRMGNEQMMILANSGKDSGQISIPIEDQGKWRNALSDEPEGITGSKDLRPYEVLVLSRVIRL